MLNKKVAVDRDPNSVISELTKDLSYQTYCIACHPNRPSLVVANSRMFVGTDVYYIPL